MAEDGLLPKAPIYKMVRDALQKRELSMRVSADFISKIVEAATEFTRIVSTQANEISQENQKTTIAPEHVLSALEILEFSKFLDQVKEACDEKKEQDAEFRKQKKERKKGSNLSQEELIARQQKALQEAYQRQFLHAEALTRQPEGAGTPAASAQPTEPTKPAGEGPQIGGAASLAKETTRAVEEDDYDDDGDE